MVIGGQICLIMWVLPYLRCKYSADLYLTRLRLSMFRTSTEGGAAETDKGFYHKHQAGKGRLASGNNSKITLV